jgi:hypothetical protein
MRRTLASVAALLAVVVAVTLAAPPAHAARPHPKNPRKHPGTLVLQTIPATPGVKATADGSTATSDSSGVIRLPVANFENLNTRLKIPDQQVSPNEKIHLDRYLGDVDSGVSRPVQVGLDVTRQVNWSFLDLQNEEVPLRRITSMRLRSSTGQVINLTGTQLTQPLWLNGGYVKQNAAGLRFKDMYWVVDSVSVEGTDTVNRAQQKFFPMQRQTWPIHLMFYTITVRAKDFLFSSPAGTGVTIKWPNGTEHYFPFTGQDRSALVASVPRGAYDLKIKGLPVSFVRPAQISRDQTIVIRVATTRDIYSVGAVLLAIAVLLLLIGRRRRIWRFVSRHTRKLRGRQAGAPYPDAEPDAVRDHSRALPCVALLAAASIAAVMTATPSAHAAGATTPPQSAGSSAALTVGAHDKVIDNSPVPVLAYYYIWFSTTSWNRAKIDFPVVGRYSSDNPTVMRKQIEEAKAAGIVGFLVSWKDTPTLTSRLTKLAQIAAQEHFKLGIVYEALDFNRKPLPITQVGKDLTMFADKFASNPVFQIFDAPIVVWTGTEDYSTEELATVTTPLKSRLLFLASAKGVDDYLRVADLFRGDAYYWSSVNPDTAGYQKKLDQMSAAVHQHGGLWIAPAAPGFDARLIGGHSVVGRDGGSTLRNELAAARASSPDALGIISWNEFSENTYIEPSEKYGSTALEVLTDALHAHTTVRGNPDSSSPPPHRYGGLSGMTAIAVFGGAAAVFAIGAFLARRFHPFRRLGR